MKEKITTFMVDGKEYKAVFNLNVMQMIQSEFGTIEKWGMLTDGYEYDADGERIPLLDNNGKQLYEIVKDKNDNETKVYLYKTKECDIKALIFGIREMLNEGIDIDNETSDEKKDFLTDKQVGRLISKMGLLEASKKANEAVVDSTKEDNPKNE